VTDDESIYVRRARTIVEHMLSREKFLFTVSPQVTGQGASSRLTGPCAPVSELAALYEISGRQSPVLLRLAEEFYGKTRTLNLDDPVRGDIWQNALALYRASGDAKWLEKARAGADRYIQERIATPQADFSDPASRGWFFWTSYTPNWMELFELFAATAATVGRDLRRPAPGSNVVGSTDMGNVSYEVPGIHPMLRVAPPGVSIHTPEFARYAAGPEGDEAVIDGAKAMAMTVLDLWLDPAAMAQVSATFVDHRPG
jgi:hypothetical protein